MVERALADRIIEAIEKKFKEYNLYCDVYNDYCGICIDINWGDWKHEHLRADWLTGEVLDAMGYAGKYSITTQVTEEDGSDTYSAIHVIRLQEA